VSGGHPTRGEPVRSIATVEGAGNLLQLVRNAPASTIAELASAMGLSRSTVLQRLEFLQQEDLISFEAAPTRSRGRPPMTIAFNPTAGIVLAAQIGLSGCRLAATDLRGDILSARFVDTDISTGPTGLLSRLQETFDGMLDEINTAASTVAGVGVGMPSAVELQNYSRSLGSSGVNWDGDYFRRELWNRYDAPVFLDLDVNLLALAERRKSWPDAEVFVCVKLGTLIDAAIVVNDVPVRGAGNLAGELGHIKVAGSQARCSCGGVGCLDAVASGSALVKQIAAHGVDVHHVSELVALARAGHPEAVRLVRDAGRMIGEALASAVNLLNPSAIVTWGYLTEAEAPLFAGIREGLYQKALPEASRDLHLMSAALGDLAGVRGAAMLVIDEVLEPSAVDRRILSQSWSDAWKHLRLTVEGAAGSPTADGKAWRSAEPQIRRPGTQDGPLPEAYAD
jgi:glucokinase